MAKRFGGQPLSGTEGITRTSKPSHDASNDHSGLLDPARDPHAVTDTHTTMPAPKTGTIKESGGDHAGAGGRGRS